MSSSATSTQAGPMSAWRRASRCSSSGCVEVALSPDRIAIRDSKDAASPVLVYDRDEWQAFIAGVKAGEFDVPDAGAAGPAA